MMTLPKIGETVRIRSVRERGTPEAEAVVGKVGTVIARRVVDGSSFGFVVQFEDGSTRWFFEKELDPVA